MKTLAILTLATLIAVPTQSKAAEISTHVLDLASGVGGKGVSVELMKKSDDKTWEKLATGTTDENGRIKAFKENANYASGTYKLVFDMESYEMSKSDPFFPEIDVVFKVDGDVPHYHVPVVVSPYGYSTYRGN